MDEEEIKIVHQEPKTLVQLVLHFLIQNYQNINLEKLITHLNPREKVVLLNDLIVRVDKLKKWNSPQRFKAQKEIKCFINQFLLHEQVFNQFFECQNDFISESLAYIFSRYRIYGGDPWYVFHQHASSHHGFFKNFNISKKYLSFIQLNLNRYIDHFAPAFGYPPYKVSRFQKYAKIPINYALFLSYIGEYELALTVLEKVKKVLEWLSGLSLQGVPSGLKKTNNLLLRHCNIQYLSISNKMGRLDKSKEIYLLDFNFYDADKNAKKRRICEMIICRPKCIFHAFHTSEQLAKTLYNLESSKYFLNLGDFKKSQEYFQKLTPISFKLPLPVIIDILRHSSYLALRLENIQDAKNHIQACLFIFFYLINQNGNYVLPSPTKLHYTFPSYNKICILFLDLISEFGNILVETDMQYHCNRTAGYAHKHLENTLGRSNLKTILSELQKVEIRFKSQVYRLRMFFTYTEYPYTDSNLYMCEPLARLEQSFILDKDNATVLIKAKMLQLFIRQETAYCYYHVCPEIDMKNHWAEAQKSQHQINLSSNKFDILCNKFKQLIKLAVEILGQNHIFLAKLYYRFGLLILHGKVYGRYIIAHSYNNPDKEWTTGSGTTLPVPHYTLNLHISNALNLINKGLDIERKIYGSDHYKYLTHKAMYKGDLLWVKFIFGYIDLTEKREWMSLYKNCATKIKKVFGGDDNHSVCRFCYCNLIRIMNLEVNLDSISQEATYSQLNSQWYTAYEDKNRKEKDNWETNTWLSGGKGRIPTDWQLEQVLASTNYPKFAPKNFLKDLYFYHSPKTKYFDPYKRLNDLENEKL